MNTLTVSRSHFTIADENHLIWLAKKYKKEIYMKPANAQERQMKKLNWEKLVMEFNKTAQVQRTSDRLKSKLDYLRKINKLFYKKVPDRNEEDENGKENIVPQSISGVPKVEFAPNPQHSRALKEVKPIIQLVKSSQEPEAAVIPKTSQTPIITGVFHSLNSDLNIPDEGDVEEMNEFLQNNQNAREEDTVIENADFCETVSAPLPTDYQDTYPVSGSSQMFAAQTIYYRNKDKRDEQRNTAELKNLALKRKILEIELKQKQKQFGDTN